MRTFDKLFIALVAFFLCSAAVFAVAERSGALQNFVTRTRTVQVEPGVVMRLDTHDFVAGKLLFEGAYQPHVRDAIRERLHEGSVAIDVGAQIGYDTLTAAVAVGRSGKVVAIEPDRESLSKLSENIALSRAANVVVEPVACSDKDGSLTLYEGPQQNTAVATTQKDLVNWKAAAYTVPARTLDGIVSKLGLHRVDVIKIDTEGAELSVLKGSVETLRKYHPRLVVELYAPYLAKMHASISDVDALLESAGYNYRHQIDQDGNWIYEMRETTARTR